MCQRVNGNSKPNLQKGKLSESESEEGVKKLFLLDPKLSDLTIIRLKVF